LAIITLELPVTLIVTLASRAALEAETKFKHIVNNAIPNLFYLLCETVSLGLT
jgi:hypothetical protein